MKKKLSEMTLEELWRLFPIFLTEHDPDWKIWYSDEVDVLKKALPKVAFYHIGSTAVTGIAAKPIVDILAVVDDGELSSASDILQKIGYIVMSSSSDRISLNKGYTEDGYAERVFHLHLRRGNDVDEIYFRDYLNACPDIASLYESLKLGLAQKYKYDRDAYTDAKTEFIKKYTAKAKKELQ